MWQGAQNYESIYGGGMAGQGGGGGMAGAKREASEMNAYAQVSRCDPIGVYVHRQMTGSIIVP